MEEGGRGEAGWTSRAQITHPGKASVSFAKLPNIMFISFFLALWCSS